jgi:hypothetical protein
MSLTDKIGAIILIGVVLIALLGRCDLFAREDKPVYKRP